MTLAAINKSLKAANLPVAFRPTGKPRGGTILTVNCSEAQFPNVIGVMVNHGYNAYRVYGGIDTEVQAAFIPVRRA